MLLVSAVMPTRGRSEWAKRALNCFHSQDYAHRELIVIDDADERSFPEGIDHPQVRYVVNEERLQIPHKRNQATRLAQGEIIWNLDSDDWSAPTRMSDQVKRLVEVGKPLTGYSRMVFYNEADKSAWVYNEKDYPYIVGTSMCFWKWWGELRPFSESKPQSRNGLIVATDHNLVRDAAKAGELSTVRGEGMMVARVHSGSSAVKTLESPYTRGTLDMIPKEFFQ